MEKSDSISSPITQVPMTSEASAEDYLLVFDLDHTLWPFDCDKDVISPFSSIPYVGTIDRFERYAEPFKDVRKIFEELAEAGKKVAIASRNPSQGTCEELLRAIKISPHSKKDITCLWDLVGPGLFHAYSSNGRPGKTRHFEAIKEASGVNYGNMIFFDDLQENIAYAATSGVVANYVKKGLTQEAFKNGIELWRKKLNPPAKTQ